MHVYEARVREIRLEQGGRAAWLECPPVVVPAWGRYVMAWAEVERELPLALPLFAGDVDEAGFLALLPREAPWEPGTRLKLRGPLGRGFELPRGIRRLALAALGETSGRLLPLARQVLAQDAATALFTDLPVAGLPAALEINPLSMLPEAVNWADFLVLDVPLERLPGLHALLGLESPGAPLPCQGQALVMAPMPCGGLAVCGVCALPERRPWKMVCQDGPVFEVRELV